MALRIYNTKRGEKESFTPREAGKLGLYVCGVTTYDYSHIGHGRAMVVFDVLYREMQRRGYDVTFVRNYTDVDDKIIRRAAEEGVTAQEVADKYVAATREDVAALGCMSPTHEPRVTEHIQDIVDLVRTLVDKGHAYESGGDVYFSVESFEPYGEFSGRNLADLRAGARVEVNEQKRNPLDFALWKASKPGEPSWSSPWGDGRPGWHIECSAMCAHYLGDTFDIHGGGSDLIFPHHENEIAQSEAASGKTLARYWMHNGMITVDAEKMSKSLKNFFTVREALARFHRETIRIFLLSTHYRSPVDFSNEILEEAEARLERLYQAVEQGNRILARRKTERDIRIRKQLIEPGPFALAAARPWENQEFPWDVPVERWSPAERELFELSTRVTREIDEAMDDDFNTARAIGKMFELARGIGRFAAAQPKGSAYSSLALGVALPAICGFGRQVLGILGQSFQEFQDDLNLRRLAERDIDKSQILASIREREEARKARDWARSDQIRDSLAAQGVILEDTREGTIWKVASRSLTSPQ